MYVCRLCLSVVLMLGACAWQTQGSYVAAQETRDSTQLGFIKGMSWGWPGWRGAYAGSWAEHSLRELAETHANWVCIAFSTNLRRHDDPSFSWGAENSRMVSDDEIRRAIDLAREQGFQVILKPVVNCRDGVWRAWIRFFRPMTAAECAAGTESAYDPWGEDPGVREGMVRDVDAWNTWWNNYQKFLVHYARIAEEKQVELFCIGCEMNSSEEFSDRWREAISQVRAEYHGPLTYDCNHGREDRPSWWDAVDVIGVSAYYAVPPTEGQSIEEAASQTTPKEEIVAELVKVRTRLAEINKKWGKPILFIETGVTSVRGCARYPWEYLREATGVPIDQQEQVNFYEAMFEVFWHEPWFIGYAWWDWPARLYPADRADEDRGFCVYGKRAEKVLTQWYGKSRSE